MGLKKTESEKAWQDLRQGLQKWRIWLLMGLGDIRQRYKRSKIGQFWMTISLVVFVAAIGVVYAALFKQPVAQFLPFLAARFMVWVLLSGIVNDSVNTFIQAETFLRQDAFPKTTFIMRVMVRNFVSFAHNLVVLPFIFLAFGMFPSWTWILALLGLALVAIAGFLVCLVSSILCTRFRDLPQVLQSFVQVAFFITPVTWRPEFLGEGLAQYVILLNPFAPFLSIVADPLVGEIPRMTSYLLALGSTVLLAVIAYPLFVRFRARIVFWL